MWISGYRATFICVLIFKMCPADVKILWNLQVRWQNLDCELSAIITTLKLKSQSIGSNCGNRPSSALKVIKWGRTAE